MRVLVLPASRRAERLDDWRFDKHVEIIQRLEPSFDIRLMNEGEGFRDVPGDSFILVDVEGEDGVRRLHAESAGVRARCLVARVGALGLPSDVDDDTLSRFLSGLGVCGGFPRSTFPIPQRYLHRFVGRLDFLRQVPSLDGPVLRNSAGRDSSSYAALQCAGWSWLPQYCRAVRGFLGAGWGTVGLSPEAGPDGAKDG